MQLDIVFPQGYSSCDPDYFGEASAEGDEGETSVSSLGVSSSEARSDPSSASSDMASFFPELASTLSLEVHRSQRHLVIEHLMVDHVNGAVV